MRTYGKIESAFWQNAKIRKLTDSAKLLLIYIFSCPHGNSVGCYLLPQGYIIADLGWTAERVAEHVTELVTKGFIECENETNTVKIIGWFEHNTIENDNVAKSAIKTIRALPDSLIKDGLIKDIIEINNKFINRFRNELPNSLANGLPNPEPEPEPDPEPKPTAVRAGKSFFQECFDHAVGHFPALQTANTSPIHAWETAGYDYEKHIKPAMESAAKKGVQPRSFNFFSGAIEDAATPKIKAAPAVEKPIELTPQRRDEIKQFKEKMGIHA